MIKASELRTKYFNEDLNLKDLDFHKSIIEKKIVSAAKDGKDAITVILPVRYKKAIAEWLEDNEYTVFGVNNEEKALDIFWSRELVEQMV